MKYILIHKVVVRRTYKIYLSCKNLSNWRIPQSCRIFFNEYQEYSDAAYFYKRVISIAKNADEDGWIGKGNLGYGKCYDKCDKINEAIDVLERSLE